MITSPRTTDSLPVAIIGAGPVGLAAAAHLAVRGLPFVVFESGPMPGAAMANGAMSPSSRRGDTSSTTRRGGCSRAPAGRCPIPIAIPPDAN